MAQITDVNGVSDARAENLAEEGYETVDDLATADPDDLTDVTGVGGATAPDLIESAQAVLQEEHGVEEEEDDDDDVSIEDLEEINAEEPEGYNEPRDPEDVSAEDDDPEPSEETVEPELFDVTLRLEDAESFDYLMAALVNLKHQRISSSSRQARMADGLLEEFRPLGGAGEVTLEMDSDELNTLHSAVKQTTVNYQGSDTDAYDTLNALLDQVNEQRSEYLF